jgi:hypothetical protein
VLSSGSVIRWRGFSPAFSYYGAEFLGFVSDNEIVNKRSSIAELGTKFGFLRCKVRILDFVAWSDRDDSYYLLCKYCTSDVCSTVGHLFSQSSLSNFCSPDQ